MHPFSRLNHVLGVLAGTIAAVVVFGAEPSSVGQEEGVLYGPASPYAGVPAGQPDRLVGRGPEPDVEVLFTSEVRGYYQPCG